MRLPVLPSLVCLCALAGAQSYVTSPSQYTKYEAGTYTDGPFTTVSRYQQVHGDLRNVARTLKGIAWRRDGLLTANTDFAGRSLDLEIAMCNANYATVGTTFASNYSGSPTTIFTRKVSNSADYQAQPDSVPAPWSFLVAFDNQFAYAGTTDLLYEIKVYATSSAKAFPNDAPSSRDTSMNGAYTSVGLGCYTQNGNMLLRSSWLSNGGTNLLTLTWNVSRGPSTQPLAGLMVGATNPNVPVPGLCTPTNRLYTDAAFFVLLGGLDAFGTATYGPINVPWNAYYVGAQLTAQAAAYDLFQGGLNVAASNGITSEVAPLPTGIQLARLHATGSTTATTGTLTIGIALVTRFQY